MLRIQQYVKAQSLEEAYTLLTKNRNNQILGGMCWLKMEDRLIPCAIDLGDLGLDKIEESEDVYLFERYKGRLNGLTPAGERFYVNAEHIINEYKNMMEDLREDSVQFKGKVRIGIPPLILGIAFSDVVAQ